MLAGILYFLGYNSIAELATLFGVLFLVLAIALLVNLKRDSK
jgi:hypothetical protein